MFTRIIKKLFSIVFPDSVCKHNVSKYYGSGSLTGENLRKDFIEVYLRGQKEGTKRGAEA